MDAFSAVTGFVGGGLGYILPFLLVLGVVVFVHESGHFWVGRMFGTRIEAFSIGFGRSIARWKDRHGTEWKVGWLPLGGYVKFWGDEDASSLPNKERLEKIAVDPEAARSFHFKPLWQRALIVAAGPFTNFLFAVMVFASIYITAGKDYIPPVVGQVLEGSAAEQAGLQPGDTILAIGGRRVASFSDIVQLAYLAGGDPVAVDILRDGQRMSVTASPQRIEEVDRFGNKFAVYRLGVGSLGRNSAVFERLDPFSAVAAGAGQVYLIVEHTMTFLGRLITGREDPRQLSGPLGIAKTSGEIATLGLLALIQLMAVLSVSVGLLNLFPIPMLDGGHLLYYGIEAVRRRPMGDQAQEYGLRMGLALVLGLMLFATWNDVMRIFWS
ncbi:MAG: RIP metalloprotease RseP [Micropepsaceae bacterium]